MKRLFTVAAFTLLCCTFGMAQQRHCGTILTTAEERAAYQKFRSIIDAELASGNASNKSRALVTIPVVVHIIHDGDVEGENENIPDAQVLSQIEVLNEDFRRLNADATATPSAFETVAADFEVEFCLAQQDTNGNPTNGIQRINAGRISWTRNDLDNDLKPNTRWDNQRYMNIWTVRMGGQDASILGYAPFPGTAGEADGVVVQYDVFGRGSQFALDPNHDNGRTTTHEVGHWLGLSHLWGNGDPLVDDCNADDGVNDTPPQAKANYGCPTFPSLSCMNGPDGDMFMNYMDYVNDDCYNMFSEGQKAIITATFNTERIGITTSQACISPSLFAYDIGIDEVLHPLSFSCSGAFTPTMLVRNVGTELLTDFTIGYQIDNAVQQFTNWSGSLEQNKLTHVSIPAITLADGSYQLTITLFSPNGQQDENFTNDQRIINFTVADQLVDSDPYLLQEGFQDQFPPVNWTTDNAQNDRDWEQYIGQGGFGSSGRSARFDNYTTTTNFDPSGRTDRLITPVLSFTPVGGNEVAPLLEFSIAYARRNTIKNDSLRISYTFDCGTTWKRIWAAGADELATASATANEFIPTASDWKTYKLELRSLIAQDRVQLRFENISDGGNALYIDDVNIRNIGVGIAGNGAELNVQLYPNPSTGQFTVDLPNSEAALVKLRTLTGQEITEGVFLARSGNSINVKTANLLPGIYLVEVIQDDARAWQKVIIQ